MKYTGITVSLQIRQDNAQIQYEMQELEQLCNACDIEIVASYIQKPIALQLLHILVKVKYKKLLKRLKMITSIL